MNYTNGVQIRIGDHVIVEKNVEGVVVCDYDIKSCLPGYDKWLTSDELESGGTLASGIMVETKELGFLYYAEQDEDISAKL